MATRKNLKRRSAYLVVWSSSREELRLGVLTSGAYADFSSDYSHVDQSFLMLLDRQKRALRDLRGIGVVSSALGSFASSRLLLATLNIFAWSRNIPIFSMPEPWERLSTDDLYKKISSRLERMKSFSSQIAPVYHAPADITFSRKKNICIVSQ